MKKPREYRDQTCKRCGGTHYGSTDAHFSTKRSVIRATA